MLGTKIHLAVDAYGLPVRVIITASAVADCKQAACLIDGFSAEVLLADKGYESNLIIEKALNQRMKSMVSSKKNRKYRRDYDTDIYKLRHLVKSTFLHLKRWCGLAHSCAKNSAFFLAAV